MFWEKTDFLYGDANDMAHLEFLPETLLKMNLAFPHLKQYVAS